MAPLKKMFIFPLTPYHYYDNINSGGGIVAEGGQAVTKNEILREVKKIRALVNSLSPSVDTFTVLTRVEKTCNRILEQKLFRTATTRRPSAT